MVTLLLNLLCAPTIKRGSVWVLSNFFGSVTCGVCLEDWQKLPFKYLRAINFRPICLFKDKNNDNFTKYSLPQIIVYKLRFKHFTSYIRVPVKVVEIIAIFEPMKLVEFCITALHSSVSWKVTEGVNTPKLKMTTAKFPWKRHLCIKSNIGFFKPVSMITY